MINSADRLSWNYWDAVSIPRCQKTEQIFIVSSIVFFCESDITYFDGVAPHIGLQSLVVPLIQFCGHYAVPDIWSNVWMRAKGTNETKNHNILSLCDAKKASDRPLTAEQNWSLLVDSLNMLLTLLGSEHWTPIDVSLKMEEIYLFDFIETYSFIATLRDMR